MRRTDNHSSTSSTQPRWHEPIKSPSGRRIISKTQQNILPLKKSFQETFRILPIKMFSFIAQYFYMACSFLPTWHELPYNTVPSLDNDEQEDWFIRASNRVNSGRTDQWGLLELRFPDVVNFPAQDLIADCRWTQDPRNQNRTNEEKLVRLYCAIWVIYALSKRNEADIGPKLEAAMNFYCRATQLAEKLRSKRYKRWQRQLACLIMCAYRNLNQEATRLGQFPQPMEYEVQGQLDRDYARRSPSITWMGTFEAPHSLPHTPDNKPDPRQPKMKEFLELAQKKISRYQRRKTI